jgi:DNA-binding PadR family transcriptional regulator
MERKPVRLSGTSYAVLSLIGYLGEATPYDLKQAMTVSIENFWPVPHTTFYAEPTRLAAAGFLEERQEQHGRRRKLYTLTAAGRAALDAWLGEPKAAPPEIRDEAILKVFAGADPEPLLRERREWHVGKLAWLQQHGVANEFGLAGLPGPTRSWLGGVGYHESAIKAIDDVVELHASGRLDELVAQLGQLAATLSGGEPSGDAAERVDDPASEPARDGSA